MATMTAAQRRQAEREAFDAYLATCPSRKLLDPIKHLKAWAEDHVPEVREAQEAYDQAQGVLA